MNEAELKTKRVYIGATVVVGAFPREDKTGKMVMALSYDPPPGATGTNTLFRAKTEKSDDGFRLMPLDDFNKRFMPFDQMSFGLAMVCLEHELQVQRKGWGPAKLVKIRTGVDQTIVVTLDDKFERIWIPEHADMVSNDWLFVV